MTDLYLITKGFSWLERLIVVQEVAGSSPVFHPQGIQEIESLLSFLYITVSRKTPAKQII